MPKRLKILFPIKFRITAVPAVIVSLLYSKVAAGKLFANTEVCTKIESNGKGLQSAVVKREKEGKIKTVAKGKD